MKRDRPSGQAVWISILSMNVLACVVTFALMAIHLRNTHRSPDSQSLLLGAVLMSGPYFVLAYLSILTRNVRWAQGLLFSGSLLIGGFGVWIIGINTQFSSLPPHVDGDDLTAVVVVIFQWPATAVLMLLVGACALYEARFSQAN